MKRALCFIFLLFTLILWMPYTLADEQITAQDITAKCRITVSAHAKYKSYLTDRSYNDVWDDAGRGYIEFEMPVSSPCFGVYIQWDTLVDFALQTQDENGVWQDSQSLHADYYNQYIPLEGLTHFRIQSRVTDRKKLMGVREVTLLGEGQIPDSIQVWKPFEGKADMLIISAHPDDELLFFGGMIPYYAVCKGYRVQVAYITSVTAKRRIELLDGLWKMGIRDYPVMPTAGFMDVYASTKKEIFKTWREENLEDYITYLLRLYQPDVVVTHDLNGEYGHGAHKAVAAVTVKAVTKLAAKAKYTGSRSKKLEPWEVKKLYLHLYESNQVVMDWGQPEACFDGKTPLQMAQQAYLCHISQQNGHHEVQDVHTGVYDNHLFGLYYSAVGEDVKKNDLMENIVPEAQEAQQADVRIIREKAPCGILLTAAWDQYEMCLQGPADCLTDEKVGEIISAFRNHESITLTDPGFIDAEKMSSKLYSDLGEWVTTDAVRANGRWGDNQLCWAASVSNMLFLSGWAQTAGGPFENEDELFSYYVSCFPYGGGYQRDGILYFCEGITEGETYPDRDGVLYIEGVDIRNYILTLSFSENDDDIVGPGDAEKLILGIRDGGAVGMNIELNQVLYTRKGENEYIWSADGTGEDLFITKDAFETYYTFDEYGHAVPLPRGSEGMNVLLGMVALHTDGYYYRAEEFMDGDYCFMAPVYCDPGELDMENPYRDLSVGNGAHAITVNGFIRSEKGIEALFVTDSDDDAAIWVFNEDNCRKELRPNRCTLYIVSPCLLSSGSTTLCIRDYAGRFDALAASVTLLKGPDKAVIQ